MVQEIVAFSQKDAACSHGSYVDIVGVTGSIPVTPTIQINDLAEKDVAAGRFDKPAWAEYRAFVDRCNRITDRDILENEIRRAFPRVLP